MVVVVTIPIRTVSEANRAGRVHWAIKARRARDQRGTTCLALRSLAPALLDQGCPMVCTLTRIAPRELDDDNLRPALKSVRDGVADSLGIDDRNSRVVWKYAQRKGEKPREVGVQIRIEPATLDTQSAASGVDVKSPSGRAPGSTP